MKAEMGPPPRSRLLSSRAEARTAARRRSGCRLRYRRPFPPRWPADLVAGVFGDCLLALFVAGAVVAWRTRKVQWPDVGRSRQATDADRKSDTRKTPARTPGLEAQYGWKSVRSPRRAPPADDVWQASGRLRDDTGSDQSRSARGDAAPC